MVPETEIELDLLEGMEEDESEMPSYDFKVNRQNSRVSGYVEELEAVEQAIYIMLATERYEQSIYPSSYGVELNDLVGEDKEWVIPELELRIKEALLIDERITDVTDFTFDCTERGKILVTFVVETTKGTLDVEKEVKI